MGVNTVDNVTKYESRKAYGFQFLCATAAVAVAGCFISGAMKSNECVQVVIGTTAA